MKKIDFFYEKRDLHRKMLNAIEQLVKMTKEGVIYFDEECDGAYAYFEPDGYDSATGLEIDAVKYDEILRVHNSYFDIGDDYSWYKIDECSNVIWCNIDTIYEAAYDSLVRSDGFKLIKHGETKYLCRYVHSSEVGITDIDENILIAPESLLDSINVLCGGEDKEVDKKVYYYAKDDIMDLPYKEFCDALRESGID